MVRVRLVVVAALLVVHTGCAYQFAMRKGDRLAAAGEWVEAYEAYDAAVGKRPDDDQAVAARIRARDKVVDDAIAAGRLELSAGKFEEAADKIAVAEQFDRDRPEVNDLRRDVEAGMRNELIRLWEGGDGRGTYAMAIRTTKLYPRADFLAATFDQLRSHFASRADTLLKQKKYDVALASIRTIAEFEPDRKAEVAPTEQRILGAWADDLVTKGNQHLRAKHGGAAAGVFAHAYELAGRAADLERTQQAVADLALNGPLTIKLDAVGVPARAAGFRSTVAAGVAAIPDARIVSTAGAVLSLKLVVPPQRCTAVDAVTKATKDYVSGQVEKPNPLFNQLTVQLTAAKAEERKAAEAAGKIAPELKAAEATVAKFETGLQEAERRHTEAESAYDLAKQQLDAAKARRDENDAKIGELQASGAGADAVAPYEKTATELDMRVEEWSGELAKRDAVASKARKDRDTILTARGPAVNTRDRLKSANDALQKDRVEQATLASELSARLAKTPKTVMEDVISTFRYDIHDWTRTCVASVSATAAPRWTTSLNKARSYTPSQATTDRSHVGHLKAAVTEDKLLFPISDASLVGKADEETAVGLVAWVNEWTDDHFKRRVDATVARLNGDAIPASNEVVTLWTGARGRLDEITVQLFHAHMKAEFGLEDLALLPDMSKGPARSAIAP